MFSVVQMHQPAQSFYNSSFSLPQSQIHVARKNVLHLHCWFEHAWKSAKNTHVKSRFTARHRIYIKWYNNILKLINHKLFTYLVMLCNNANNKARDIFAILGRGPWAFQIGKISVVNPQIGKFVMVYHYVIFGQYKNKLAITHTFAIKK